LLRHIYRVPERRWRQNLAAFNDLLELGPFLETPVRQLSLGQRMRADLAAALLHEPAILFLDEPTGGVDPLSRRQFWRLIDDFSQAGVTVLVTTHYLDEAERCNRVALIHAGTLAAIGTIAEVKQIFKGRPILEIRSDRPVDAMRVLETLPEVEKTSLFGTAVHAVLRDERVQTSDLTRLLKTHGVTVTSIDEVPPSLEDVFLDVVEKAGGAAA
jgi:ABC-2 type transport system ATP-binding protein